MNWDYPSMKQPTSRKSTSWRYSGVGWIDMNGVTRLTNHIGGAGIED